MSRKWRSILRLRYGNFTVVLCNYVITKFYVKKRAPSKQFNALQAFFCNSKTLKLLYRPSALLAGLYTLYTAFKYHLYTSNTLKYVRLQLPCRTVNTLQTCITSHSNFIVIHFACCKALKYLFYIFYAYCVCFLCCVCCNFARVAIPRSRTAYIVVHVLY